MARSTANLILTIALTASLLACSVFAYLWIDRSITLAYVEFGMNATVRQREALKSFLLQEWKGLSDTEVLERLHAEAARRPQENIVVKPESDESFIWFDSTQFVFLKGRLVEIR